MGYTYETIDGQRVEQNVAAAFRKLAAAFKATFGLTLHVTSGTRTRAEQQALYDAYRAGRGNLAAPPGQSNHEETGPRGPRALDVRDSGGDPGVTSAGTVRSNWLRQNAPAYDFDPAGFRFSQVEPWHIEFTGPLYNDPIPDEENDMTPAQEKKLDKLAADVQWLKDRVGGTLTGNTPSLPITAIVEWTKDRIGGSYKGENVSALLAAILEAVKTSAAQQGVDTVKLQQAIDKAIADALNDVEITLTTKGD